jgi:hypothetical protein
MEAITMVGYASSNHLDGQDLLDENGNLLTDSDTTEREKI